MYCQLASGFYSNTTSTRKLRPRSNFPQRTPRAKQPFHGFVLTKEPGRPRPIQPTVWRQGANPPTAHPARLSHTPLEHSSLGPGRIILTGISGLYRQVKDRLDGNPGMLKGSEVYISQYIYVHIYIHTHIYIYIYIF